jgi:c-di-GMP-binding flagellar brake protein YcgR
MAAEFPFVRQEIIVHAVDIFAGLHSTVKRIISKTELEITTPFDVSGDPFFVAIGEKITVSWERGMEVMQQEFVVQSYHEVHHFLKDTTVFPAMILSTHRQSTIHQSISREYYRTAIKLTAAVQITNKEPNKMIINDLSGGGMAILHSRPLGVSIPIQAELPILNKKGEADNMLVEGHTVNLHMIHPRLFRMGVRFHGVTEMNRDALIRFVNGCTGKKRAGRCNTCALHQHGQCEWGTR